MMVESWAQFTQKYTKKGLEEYLKENPILAVKMPCMPADFIEFNRVLYQPLHPANNKPTDIYDYQLEYFNAIRDHHKVILNKSRKIGATETALRVILYNIFMGYYAHKKIMIVAGTNQTTANKFITRIMKMLSQPFVDLNGKTWNYKQILKKYKSRYIEFINGAQIEAYPANEAVRGEENVICVFMSEAAFINKVEDTKVYNALKPNVINIPHADFILESTPNGKRGFFYHLAQEAQRQENEFYYLEMNYVVSLNKLLTKSIIEQEKRNSTINFEQEYCCKFTTNLNSAFDESQIPFIPQKVKSWDEI